MAAPLGDSTIRLIVLLFKEGCMDIAPIHKGVIGLDIHQNKISACAIAAFMASKEKKGMPWTRETIALLIFVCWMLFTTFFAFYSDPAWLQWNKVWKIQLMIFLTALIITDRHQLHWLIWVIALSFGFYGVKSGIFTIINGSAYRVQGPSGTFIGGNNELALVMTIPLIRYLHLQEKRRLIKLGLVAAMVLTGVAAIGSQSRGGLAAMLAMGLFLWLKSRNKIVTGSTWRLPCTSWPR
jgi:probable O-glycosylation ligase (exosortase A-associated)